MGEYAMQNKELGRDSKYFVQSFTITEEMFFAGDLRVIAVVRVNDHPLGWVYGKYSTDLFRIKSKGSISHYRRNAWRHEGGCEVMDLNIRNGLDLDLRAHLLNRWGAEFYNIPAPLPVAKIQGSWWVRFVAWLKGTFLG